MGGRDANSHGCASQTVLERCVAALFGLAEMFLAGPAAGLPKFILNYWIFSSYL